jgi:hypothetical protein
VKKSLTGFSAAIWRASDIDPLMTVEPDHCITLQLAKSLSR